MSMGFPMAVAAMSDDPRKALFTINMIITVGYISSISVGPALGSVGEVAAIYVAFSIPLALMILSAILLPVTKNYPSMSPKTSRAANSICGNFLWRTAAKRLRKTDR